jgi:hypothetical protein
MGLNPISQKTMEFAARILHVTARHFMLRSACTTVVVRLRFRGAQATPDMLRQEIFGWLRHA